LTLGYGTGTQYTRELAGVLEQEQEYFELSRKAQGLLSTVTNAQLSASSVYGDEVKDATHGPGCRLLNSEAWVPKTLPNQWIQCDFQKPVFIVGIATQGRPSYDQWTKNYLVYYSVDGTNWLQVDGLFKGNTDRNTVVRRDFVKPVRASAIRVQINEYDGHPALRWDVFGFCI